MQKNLSRVCEFERHDRMVVKRAEQLDTSNCFRWVPLGISNALF
jgi:hypothetical protein